ncbi:hypothetical protein ES703_97943 [subsurface metagenome]
MANRLDIFYLGKKGLALKRLVSFIISLAFIFIISGSTNANGKGNTKFQSFNKAKKILLRQIYRDHRTTFYCQVPFTKDKEILSSSKYIPKKKWKRAHRLEWEHIVPAHAFGQSFKEWREGHPKCVNKKGKAFKGRNCARKST